MGPKTPDLFKFLFEILNVLSFSVEVYTRHSFGERYINWLRFIFAMLLLNTIMGFFRMLYMLPLIGGGIYPQMSSLFWYSFIGLTLYHLYQIWQRNRRGIAWHSRSFGVSRLEFLPLNDAMLYRFVEPLACIVVSFVLRPFSPFTANWLLISSFCLLIKNNLIFNAARGRVLDVIDGRIEAAVMAGDLEGQDKRKTAGWSQVVAVSTDLDFSKQRAAAEAAPMETADSFAAAVAELMDGSANDDDAGEEMEAFTIEQMLLETPQLSAASEGGSHDSDLS